MRPQFSIIFFTTLAGMAQGLLFSLALLNIPSQVISPEFLSALAFPAALLLLTLGLLASFFHLGHPERAWRAAMMWKTSWLSREVIALPALMGLTSAAYIYSRLTFEIPFTLWLALIIATLILWICTAKIYQCIRFIQEWSHPSTMLNFILLGLTSGWMLLSVLILFWEGDSNSLIGSVMSGIAFMLLFVAFILKLWHWNRNRNLKPKSNLSSATGIKSSNIRQLSMGLMGGSFNTREFFHHQTDRLIKNLRKVIILLCYVVPMIFTALAFFVPSITLLVAALAIHYIGSLAERWMFFADANHPQNLYYQRVS